MFWVIILQQPVQQPTQRPPWRQAHSALFLFVHYCSPLLTQLALFVCLRLHAAPASARLPSPASYTLFTTCTRLFARPLSSLARGSPLRHFSWARRCHRRRHLSPDPSSQQPPQHAFCHMCGTCMAQSKSRSGSRRERREEAELDRLSCSELTCACCASHIPGMSVHPPLLRSCSALFKRMLCWPVCRSHDLKSVVFRTGEGARARISTRLNTLKDCGACCRCMCARACICTHHMRQHTFLGANLTLPALLKVSGFPPSLNPSLPAHSSASSLPAAGRDRSTLPPAPFLHVT